LGYCRTNSTLSFTSVETNETKRSLFQSGDHVCVGQGRVQHHAIVVKDETENGIMVIVEYGAFAHTDGQLLQMVRTRKQRGVVRKARVRTNGRIKWKLVDYSKSDCYIRKAGDVVAAAHFLLNNSYLLPPYHLTFCNCECVARWCKRGVFTSGQAKDFYKTSLAVGLVATPLMAVVAIPLAPFVATMGVAAGSRRVVADSKWNETRDILEKEFEEYYEDMGAKEEGFEVVATFNKKQ